jgi:hypothetical protein
VFFKIRLAASSIATVEDPVFQITVSRSVSYKRGWAKDDSPWDSFWLQHRSGRHPNRNIKWDGQIAYNLVDFIIVAGAERCPECDPSL